MDPGIAPLRLVPLAGPLKSCLLYSRRVMSARDAGRLFREIVQQCKPGPTSVRMRGRDIVVKRLQSAHGDNGLKYVQLVCVACQ